MHLKLFSKVRILGYFSKTWLKIWTNRWWSSLFWCNRSILHIFFFLHARSFATGESSPAMHGWSTPVCLWFPIFSFFGWNTSGYMYFSKITISVVFVSNNFTELQNINENIQPSIAGDCPLGRFLCILKQWTVWKLQIQFSWWIAFTTMMIFPRKMSRYHSESKIQRHFSPATMAG